MGQAGLVQGLEKLTIDAPAIAHQKAGKVRPQYHGRLFKSASRMNRIDADLRGAEDPHPPQLSTHSPSGLVRGHTGTGANLCHQRLIGRFGFVGHTLQCLTQSTATHPQSEGLLQHGGRLAVGQSQTFIELRGQGQRSGAQLRSRTADRIGGLPGMPALHPPSAMPATSHMNAKLNALHSWFRNLGLILGYDAPFLHSPSAMRTLPRQGYLDDLIDTSGNRPTTSPPVLASCFASRFLRVDGLSWKTSPTSTGTVAATIGSTGEVTCSAPGTVTITASAPQNLQFTVSNGVQNTSATVSGTAMLICQ